MFQRKGAIIKGKNLLPTGSIFFPLKLAPMHIENNFKLALLHTILRVYYTNIPSCRRDESKMRFPLQEGIFVYSRVFE